MADKVLVDIDYDEIGHKYAIWSVNINGIWWLTIEFIN